MFEEPPLPDIEDGAITKLCVRENEVIAYINAAALASLMWYFWWLAVECPRGEDISLSNDGEMDGTSECSPLSYCEITMTGEGPITGHLHNPVAEYRERLISEGRVRVDLYVNRLQAQHGYQSLQHLGGDK